MEDLSLELVERICEYLPREDLQNTLTVSREFRYASERACGAFATFCLDRDNVEKFRERYAGRRWGYLRHVKFQVRIPAYKEDSCDHDMEGEEEDGSDDGEGFTMDDYNEDDGDDSDGESGNGNAQDDDDDANEMESQESVETHDCRESAQELAEMDNTFSNQIRFLFDTIKTVEQDVSEGRLQLTIYAPVREVHTTCPHRKCVSWRLHLLSASTLPKLRSVRALSIENPRAADPLTSPESLLHIDLRVLIDLAVQCPRLEFLGCKLHGGSAWTTAISGDAPRHYRRIWAGPLRDTRLDFAKAVAEAEMPSTLRQAQLDLLGSMHDAEEIDQSQPLPNLAGSRAHDPFSTSLRLLSHNLRRLEIKAVADAALLWPTDGRTTSYPNLESVTIALHMSSPSGHWYFEGPHGKGHNTSVLEVDQNAYPPLHDTPSDKQWDAFIDDNGLVTENVSTERFRVEPNPAMLTPFLTSFALAARNMPVLKEACLWTPLVWNADEGKYGDAATVSRYPDSDLAWGITYAAPGAYGLHTSPGQHHAAVRQLWWTTGKWRPSEQVRELFQGIGDEKVELVEYWGHERYGEDQLAARSVFDRFQVFGWRDPENAWRVGKV
ncbi:unnamed protein product [Periconia digitata]|uniref:F-box domain-containing protein n=1 Tax=Periconia digitata TaxID=1303443 RepID=A0A9W4UAF0_9PLEO|nr:unnamed protein product [Periconia digitata]